MLTSNQPNTPQATSSQQNILRYLEELDTLERAFAIERRDLDNERLKVISDFRKELDQIKLEELKKRQSKDAVTSIVA